MRRLRSFCILLGVALACGLPPLGADEKSDDKSLESDLVAALRPRCIGPGNMGGRICDVAVVEKRPATIYFAAATGGVWKTTNHGSTWEPIFDSQPHISTGAVAVSQSNPDVVWVGTGEANARNSVSWGDGVYKSTDGGKTWKHMGLADTQHIGRVAIHPTNPDVVYVAALGHLWGPNKERGLYKTSDGGKTWVLSKFINEDTGFIDVAVDPLEPDTVYAAAYQVRRDGFSGGNPAVQHGPGSGLFKTTDGGKSWEKMTDGLPKNNLGRSGFSIYRKNPNIVYAVVQTQRTTDDTTGQLPNLTERKSKGKGGKGGKAKADPEEKKGDEPQKPGEKITPNDGGIFRSEDKGKTWKQINSLVPRPFYYGQIRVDPNDDTRVFVLGVQMYSSQDGGKTFSGNAGRGVHADVHALWIDPRDSDHIVLGCDGGAYYSFDGSKTWDHWKNLPLAQFYGIAFDMAKPYKVYGGLQDNGTWGAVSNSRSFGGIGATEWVNLMGADGFQCQADPTDPDTVYGESQYGGLTRVNMSTGQAKSIRPRLEGGKGKGFGGKAGGEAKEGEEAKKKGGFGGKGGQLGSNILPKPPKDMPDLRFNWNAPMLISPHNPRTLYYGGNHLFRSVDRGDTWQIISPDLTRGKPGPSKNAGHTLHAVAESPVLVGVLYAGTDDGRIHMTKDGGAKWVELTDRIPGVTPNGTITRLECSRFEAGTVYLSIDRHRNDDHTPYLFKSTDFGQTWSPIVNNLPPENPIYVIREDPHNKDLLYVGTEKGMFCSFDGGQSWKRLGNGMPKVRVDDLAVHPRDRDLVIGTHGRGVWIMDVGPLAQLTKAVQDKDVVLLEPKPGWAYRSRKGMNWGGTHTFLGSNPDYGAALYYYVNTPLAELPTVTVVDVQGKVVFEAKGSKEPGVHRVLWPFGLGGGGKGKGKGGAASFKGKGGGGGGFGGGLGGQPIATGEYVVELRLAPDRILRQRLKVEGEQ
jgi:photosystem II stability/assembly factor-like uncharacterized protein